MGDLDYLASHANHSWLMRLLPDPETDANAPNKTSREVKSGHYVKVLPTALADPKLVAFSPQMFKELGLDEKEAAGSRFVAFFSGDVAKIPELESWCTPYALSIYGQEMYRNCPFENGNGYGDGRAISIGELLLPSQQRWEMQLKGAGRTPFCRGADGRAVLRSSVREFLVSEAMHSLGVSTTRALSLVRSASMTVDRPWYSGRNAEVSVPNIDDPRLEGVPMQHRRMLIEQLKDRARGPDVMQRSDVAITCRMAPSFTRVGHVEIFGRRARTGGQRQRKELEMIVEHLLFREYAGLSEGLGGPKSPLQPRVLAMLGEASRRIGRLTADWIRVGYVQGNFNSDNCLAGGRTMDYGPFGFVEKFKPLWNMWSGGGEHFGFMNQPAAGEKNFGMLVKAVSPLLDEDGKKEAARIGTAHTEVARDALNQAWQRKLGLRAWDPTAASLLSSLLGLMEETEADYTIVWRQLAVLPQRHLAGGTLGPLAEEEVLQSLDSAFYAPLSDGGKQGWNRWVREWLELLAKQGGNGDEIAAGMRSVSPKYVPREWMLVEAYTKSIAGDDSAVHELQEVFEQPYEEQSAETASRFYRRTPESTYSGIGLGGTAYMT